MRPLDSVASSRRIYRIPKLPEPKSQCPPGQLSPGLFPSRPSPFSSASVRRKLETEVASSSSPHILGLEPSQLTKERIYRTDKKRKRRRANRARYQDTKQWLERMMKEYPESSGGNEDGVDLEGLVSYAEQVYKSPKGTRIKRKEKRRLLRPGEQRQEEEEEASVEALGSSLGSTYSLESESEVEDDLHDLSRQIEKQLLVSGRKGESRSARERARQKRRIALARTRMIPSTRLDPLTESEEATVSNVIRQGGVVVDKFNIEIAREDLQTLAPRQWLNDEIVNFYLQLVAERAKTQSEALFIASPSASSATSTPTFPKVHCFNTFFRKKLIDKGYAGVKKWTKKVDIFAQELILIPCHLGMHWTLAAIHVPDKIIAYYDSMHKEDHTTVTALSDYLAEEHLEKKKEPLDMSQWRIVFEMDCPAQMNGYDCGVFTIMAAEFLSRNAPLTYAQQDMQMLRRKIILEISEGKLVP